MLISYRFSLLLFMLYCVDYRWWRSYCYAARISYWAGGVMRPDGVEKVVRVTRGSGVRH